MPSIRLPIHPKADVVLDNAPRPHDVNVLYNVAGWDVDAQFPAARAKLKALPNVSIHHRFIGVAGVVMHEYSC